jgi:hypothetical protein
MITSRGPDGWRPPGPQFDGCRDILALASDCAGDLEMSHRRVIRRGDRVCPRRELCRAQNVVSRRRHRPLLARCFAAVGADLSRYQPDRVDGRRRGSHHRPPEIVLNRSATPALQTNAYKAFSPPGRLLTQRARMPDDRPIGRHHGEPRWKRPTHSRRREIRITCLTHQRRSEADAVVILKRLCILGRSLPASSDASAVCLRLG